MDKTLKTYEKKYNKSSIEFYNKFKEGEGEENDSADFMIWAGVYEMQLDSKNELQKIL